MLRDDHCPAANYGRGNLARTTWQTAPITLVTGA